MPVYEASPDGTIGPPGPGPQPPAPTGLTVGLTGWLPVGSIDPDRVTLRVARGFYLPNTLEVAISAASDGEVGYTQQFPPAYMETDNTRGIFLLSNQLPAGWLVLVRYQYLV